MKATYQSICIAMKNMKVVASGTGSGHPSGPHNNPNAFVRVGVHQP